MQFTIQIIPPPFKPSKYKHFAEIRTGSFEENRDSLSPETTDSYEISATDYRTARHIARQMFAPSVCIVNGQS